MSRCYLCESEAQIHGQDYGRRKVVRCPSCGYFEIENSAIPKIEDPSFKKQRREALARTVKTINNHGKEAEIVFDDNTISARQKPNP